MGLMLDDTTSLLGLETSRSDSDERVLLVGVQGGVSSWSGLCFGSSKTKKGIQFV